MGSFLSVALPCPTLCDGFPFILLCFTLVMFCCYLSEARSFLMRDRKEVDLDGRGGREALGGAERGDTSQGLLCEEKNLFLINRFMCVCGVTTSGAEGTV